MWKRVKPSLSSAVFSCFKNMNQALHSPSPLMFVQVDRRKLEWVLKMFVFFLTKRVFFFSCENHPCGLF